MKTKIYSIFAVLTLSVTAWSQGVGVNETGANPDASAILDASSTTEGFLPPRMTTAQRDAIPNPATGLMIYNLTVNCLQCFDGSYWYDLCNKGVSPGPENNCSISGFIAPFLTAEQTQVIGVQNPVTGKFWMDRNLGASTAARSSTDCYAHGNLYQWGRNSDGHENRNNVTFTVGPVAAGNEGSNFITITSSPHDWLTPGNVSRWNSATPPAVAKTQYDPCPKGYRVPTQTELDDERLSWVQAPISSSNNAVGAFASPLKLPLAGRRSGFDGTILATGVNGRYWSNTASPNAINNNAVMLLFTNASASMNPVNRSGGESVRCIKED